MVDNAWGVGKIFLSHVQAPSGSGVKSLKKVKKRIFKITFQFRGEDFLDHIGVKRMLRGRFCCLVCMNQTRHCWVVAVWVWFLGFGLLEARNVLSATSGCEQIFYFSSCEDTRRSLGVDNVHLIEWGIWPFLPGLATMGRIWMYLCCCN